LQGSPQGAQGQTAYVATGNYGLALVDVSNPTMPVVRGQIHLNGTSTDVSVDANLGIAAVASGTGGLNLVNVSNPTTPTLLLDIPGTFSAVRVKDGVAYAASGNAVIAYDLLTGELLQSLPVGSNPITALAVEGSILYSLDSGHVLRAIDIGDPAMATR